MGTISLFKKLQIFCCFHYNLWQICILSKVNSDGNAKHVLSTTRVDFLLQSNLFDYSTLQLSLDLLHSILIHSEISKTNLLSHSQLFSLDLCKCLVWCTSPWDTNALISVYVPTLITQKSRWDDSRYCAQVELQFKAKLASSSQPHSRFMSKSGVHYFVWPWKSFCYSLNQTNIIHGNFIAIK